jgi:hypothetical protein
MAALNLQDNRQQLFVVVFDGTLRSRWQQSLDGAWSGWVTMPTPVAIKDIATVGASGAVSQIFALGTDNQIYTQWKVGDASSAWSAWCALGGVTGAQALTAVKFGSVRQIFATGTSNIVTSWTGGALACSNWVGLQNFGNGSFGAVTAGVISDGRVHVAVVNSTGGLQRTIRAADGSAWSAWESLNTNPANSSRFVTLTTANVLDGRAQIFGVGTDGNIYTSWELSPAGAFSGPWARFY